MMRPLLLVSMIAIGVVGYTVMQAPARAPYIEASTIAEGTSNFSELQKRFGELAREEGGAYAYEVLRRAVLPPNTDLHLLGHAVGEVLYEEKGVRGIVDCTQDFRNACSHALVIGALHELGEPALDMIREACKQAPGGSGAYTMCYHGLGHGVFAYFGYDLTQTIAFCRKAGTSEYRNREYIECVGGAIMELMGGGGHDRDAWLAARANYLRPADPLSPCMDAVIPEDIKEQCLNYLTPRLWELTGINLGVPDPGQFPEAFSYCDALPHASQKLRDACFGGFGKEFLPIVVARDVRQDVVYSDAQLQIVIEWCLLAGVQDGKNACMGEAVGSAFWGGERDPETSLRLCTLAENAELGTSCYKHLSENIVQYTSEPRRGELCARLPVEYSVSCATPPSEESPQTPKTPAYPQ